MSRIEVEGSSFEGLGIAPKLLEKLNQLRFKAPTPIQHQAIPVAMTGDDVVGIAQTGTGKTLAFSLPVIQRVSRTKGQALILAPTRELALQIDETLTKVGGTFGLKTAVLIGGASFDRQKKAMAKKPHILVATPGRLIDHLEQKTVSLAKVNTLVLDEADRMLDMGFAPQIKQILGMVPGERQTLLFSATMPAEISKIANKYMKKPLRVEVAPAGTASERVEQELFILPKQDKLRLLQRILKEYDGTVLVFSRTKYGAKKIAASVRRMGHAATEIHGNRSLAQRKDALKGFKTGKYRVLVATDIAARGIDVTGIELVINFDLPDQAEDYVHRIGRTGRAGRSGKAISFACPDQGKDVNAIERLIRAQLTITKTGELPELAKGADSRPQRDRGQTGKPYRRDRSARPSKGKPKGRSGGGKKRSSSGPPKRPKRGPKKFVRYFS